MNNNKGTISYIRCQQVEPGTFSLTVDLKGGMPEKLDYLKDLQQIKDTLSAFGLRFWEKLLVIETKVVRQFEKFVKIVLTVKKTVPVFEELPFFGINHTGSNEISKKLQKTNFVDAAIIAAEYAIANQLAGVTAFYKQGDHQGMVCIVNTHVYKKLSSTDRKVDRFIGTTRCMLLKGHY